ncbi:MAG: putative dolichol monophosphate mannose synthase [uncultured marine phage]|uniref:Putative dolichol monophosphate mannose synthase n=1 Tax=uncultured marine phage TaxID=707152 RepID=A0A8D9CCR8_9VIRU|nr:MAG: putative dolichol monophosphate mannose synthase [uncultured marine phage]
MRVLYVQPIFIPSEYMLERNLRSVRSISNILKNNSDDIEVEIRLAGWSLTDDLWDRFVSEVVKQRYSKIKIERYDKNFGKAYCVNKLSEEIDNYDYMLSADSDIVFMDIPNMLSRLGSMARKVSNFTGKDFGMFALNQAEHNCHMVNDLNESFEFEEERVVWNNYPGFIAGGCIFTSKDNWKKCGGYKEMGVYAGDDAYFLIDTNKNGNTFGMIESISVIHPLDDNKEYAKWKGTVCQRDTNGVDDSLNNDQIKEATEFWVKQNKES